MSGPLIAVDWGTTNRRVFLLEHGAAVQTDQDACGVRAVEDFAAEVAAIRGRFGDHPMLLAGMVGSSLGWRETRYLPAPVGVADLAQALVFADARTAIVPGVATAADVMRGEEVQLLGAVAAGLVPTDAVLVQPGTHAKWARVAAGRLVDFTTAMTGELWALLRAGSVLAPQLAGEVCVGDAFRRGVAEGARRDLAASLFGIRAACLLRTRADADAASFASGLLIGSEVAARIAAIEQSTIHVVAGPALGALYLAAIQANGRRALIVDSHDAFVAGILAIGAHRP
ncbi:2-dehydro-3-deoxygalactonokinase [Sphingomonas guangdongensis]|uniref:2-dehydro-3-deoxygalactonokinase n=1 Tax=Sphingomonas guangdongensis TaxID=1141890 RepID=A0A285QAH0_9SPHN|nr:2-dehydro-3-deoxygalactonokinase [Sphingomonas guangdongensis]SOB78826.1 2-dehydro-3-deoxygalactonokinase [Sphingomonas guangdongensis]